VKIKGKQLLGWREGVGGEAVKIFFGLNKKNLRIKKK
jgi:hypothetical protein